MLARWIDGIGVKSAIQQHFHRCGVILLDGAEKIIVRPGKSTRISN
jgi:hypothetical protein